MKTIFASMLARVDDPIGDSPARPSGPARAPADSTRDSPQPPPGLARLLFVGDVVGPLGVSTVEALLPLLRAEHGVDFCVANGENAFATGAGIDPASAARLLRAGVDVITTGNHAHDAPGAADLLAGPTPLVRPDSLPALSPGPSSGPAPGSIPGSALAPGRATVVVERDGLRLGVANVICSREGSGANSACPDAERALAELRGVADLVVVDVHGSWPAEKLSIAWLLDGRVCAVVGTHTHVPTADARVLPEGTAYISDVGMTGARDSLIGFHPPDMVRQARDPGAPPPAPATGGPGVLMAVLITATLDGRAVAIEPVRRSVESGAGGAGAARTTGRPSDLGR